MDRMVLNGIAITLAIQAKLIMLIRLNLWERATLFWHVKCVNKLEFAFNTIHFGRLAGSSIQVFQSSHDKKKIDSIFIQI